MAVTLQNICDRAAQIASTVGGAFPVDEATAELLFPHVAKKVLLDSRKDASRLNSLRADHALPFANGEAVLPVLVLGEFLDSAVLSGDDTVFDVSYLPHYQDFVRPTYPGFGYWTVRSGKIFYKNGDPAPYSGNLVLNAVTGAQLPASASASLNLSDELIDEIVVELARALRGESPYLTLGEEEKEDKGQ